MKGPTTEEIFEKVKTHLLDQGQQSIDKNGGCAYRGAEGRKCAIGCLIADEFYSKDLEGTGSCDKGVKNAIKASIGREVTKTEAVMLSELQYMHDRQLPGEWKTQLDTMHGSLRAEGLI